MRRGIGLYVTTKRSIIKPMVYHGMRLRASLEKQLITALEVYPFAAKVRLLGKPIPKKSTLAGRIWLQERLEPLIPSLSAVEKVLSHDCLDALTAAYTAFLYSKSQVEAVGDPQEGLIYIPQQSQPSPKRSSA
jgi:predicted nuclease with RNAse H fold